MVGNVTDHHHEEYDKKITKINSNLNTKIDEEISKLDTKYNQKTTEIQTQINTIGNTLKVIVKQLNDTSLIFSPNRPSLSSGDKPTVWFCTLENQEHIEAFSSGRWYQIGAIWK